MTPRNDAPIAMLRTIDPGWLFLIAGLAIVAATVLIPAVDDLDHADFQKSLALAAESQRRDRVDRYAAYLDALDQGEPAVVRSLVASQLHAGHRPRHGLLLVGGGPDWDAAVFPHLEPEPIRMPTTRPPPPSLLARLALGDRSRLWMLAGGCLAILIGVLPRHE